MALNITAKLVDSANKPMAKVVVQAYFYRATGSVMAVGQATTNAQGDVAISVTQALPAFLPRIELRMLSGRVWRVLSNTPETYTSVQAAFGVLEVAATPVIKLGASALYSKSLSLSLPVDTVKVDSLNKEVTTLKADKVTLSKSVSMLNSEVSLLKKTNLSINRQITTLSSTNEQLNRSLAETKSQFLNEQKAKDVVARRAQQLDISLAEKNKQLENLKQELAKQAPQDTDVQDLFDNAASHLEETQRRLKSRNSSFVMSKVSMSLKVLPGRAGNSVKLPSKDEVKEVGAEALSHINIEFSDLVSSQQRGEAVQQIDVPDLMGYTLNLAQRKLQNESLVPVVLEEFVGRGEVAMQRHGRVLSQNPPSGTRVMPNSAIYLTIGKAAVES